MNTNTLWRWANVLAVLAVIGVNALANALPLNGVTTAEISARFDVYFVPAGYVFSIWGLIYLGLALFAVYQVLPGQRDNSLLDRLGPLFVLSSLANVAWLFLWHYGQFVLTLAAMVSLLALLIAIYLRLGIGKVSVSGSERWFVHVPFSIYLGWVTVATIANVSSVLDYLDWNGWGISEQVWALVMLGVATAIASAVILTRGDLAYMLVIIWAFVGIAVEQADTSIVAAGAWIASAVTALVLAIGTVRNARRQTTVVHSG